jgi:hypothetical protein
MPFGVAVLVAFGGDECGDIAPLVKLALNGANENNFVLRAGASACRICKRKSHGDRRALGGHQGGSNVRQQKENESLHGGCLRGKSYSEIARGEENGPQDISTIKNK